MKRARRALACLVALALPGCGPDPAPRRRVLVVGIDGASFRVAGPLLEQGQLPHLAALAAAGAHGSIRSERRPLSPRVWNTVSTGKVPEKHGIEHWVLEEAPGRMRLYLGSDRRVHALWNILSTAGRRVGVVNWLQTYPPEIVNGVLVSDHTFAKEVKGKKWLAEGIAKADRATLAPVPDESTLGSPVYPEEWLARARADRHRRPGLTRFANPFLGNPALPAQMVMHHLVYFFDRDEQLTSIALEIQHEIAPDLLMVLLQGIDRVSHILWQGVENPLRYPLKRRWSRSEHEEARRAIQTYYEFTDALLGRLLERYGPEDLVLVLSDHGFEAGGGNFGTGIHDSEAARDGVLFARGPGIAPGSSTEGTAVADVTPTILAWLGLPVAEDMDGRVAPFLEVEAVASVPTYDTAAIARLGAQESGADDAILEQLEVLGYIEGRGESEGQSEASP